MTETKEYILACIHNDADLLLAYQNNPLFHQAINTIISSEDADVTASKIILRLIQPNKEDVG